LRKATIIANDPAQFEVPEHVQADVVAFLRRGDWAEGDVEVVSTHISHVFLAGDRALKLKRAVKLPYVDFSTLNLRKAACEREFSLNRRTAPEIYRRVLPVTCDPAGQLHLGGAGEVVDWLVEMSAFDQDQLLDRLAKQGPLPDGIPRALGDEIAAFHDKAEIAAEFGGADAIAEIVALNAKAFAAGPPGIFAPDALAALTEGCAQALAARRSLLDSRRARGQVRRCHGDLHLGNICLIDGRPVLFDCLEFDERLSTIDVLYDLAFLLMDLLAHRLAGDANMVLNRYLDRRTETAGLAALPLFLAMRAAIRAHVTITRDPSAGEEARTYLGSALSLLHPARPRLVAIGGLSGSGKSTAAYRLAPGLGAAPGARVIRSDVIRKRLFDVSPETSLSADSYSMDVTRRVYQSMLDEAAQCLTAGHSAILDAVFLRRDERDAAADIARRTGMPFTGIWLEAPAAMLEERIAGRRNDASDADAAVLRKQLTIDPGPLDWIRVGAAKIDDTIEAIWAAIS
jgi:aminoglycoside phosphotransferase family enzyme/predicted kinase